ncbi:hypothetical protein Sjap_024093 [Stephania japonica]|uniref:Uncharacterized protein n=1 Tax=Stephania japonica TaxID=461633 RepID=A0AAP0HNM3_9MAGN
MMEEPFVFFGRKEEPFLRVLEKLRNYWLFFYVACFCELKLLHGANQLSKVWRVK